MNCRGLGASFRRFAKFADHVDKSLDSTREAPVAAVNEGELTPKVDAFDGKKLHFSGLDLIAGKAFADDGDANVCGDESFDHADARKFHGNLQAGTVRTEKFVKHLAGVAGAWKDQRSGSNFFERDVRALRERVLGADHKSQAVAIDDVHFEIGGFHGEGNDAEIERAVFQALQNFVTEITVDADVDEGIATLEFGQYVGEQIEASGFVGAEHDGALYDAATVGDDLHGFIAQAQEAFGVVEENDAGGR